MFSPNSLVSCLLPPFNLNLLNRYSPHSSSNNGFPEVLLLDSGLSPLGPCSPVSPFEPFEPFFTLKVDCVPSVSVTVTIFSPLSSLEVVVCCTLLMPVPVSPFCPCGPCSPCKPVSP